MCTSRNEMHFRKASRPIRRSLLARLSCSKCEQCAKADPKISLRSARERSTRCNRLQFSQAAGPIQVKSGGRSNRTIPTPRKHPSSLSLLEANLPQCAASFKGTRRDLSLRSKLISYVLSGSYLGQRAAFLKNTASKLLAAWGKDGSEHSFVERHHLAGRLQCSVAALFGVEDSFARRPRVVLQMQRNQAFRP